MTICMGNSQLLVRAVSVEWLHSRLAIHGRGNKRATPLIKLSIAFFSRNAIIFIRTDASVTFARGQLVGNYTRLTFATRKKNKGKKKIWRGVRKREKERGKKCRAALKGLSQKQAYSVTFNYIYLPEMTRPRLFYPAVTLTIRAWEHVNTQLQWYTRISSFPSISDLSHVFKLDVENLYFT